MANIGIPEIMVIAVIILLLLGTPALLVIIFLGLRRAAAGGPAPAAAPAPLEAPTLRAAGHVQADGSLRFASGGLQARRIDAGVYQLTFSGFDPARRYLLQATPLVQEPGDEPALVEMLSGPARDRYLAAGADEQGLLVWLRLPDRQPVDRDWMAQITELP